MNLATLCCALAPLAGGSATPLDVEALLGTTAAPAAAATAPIAGPATQDSLHSLWPRDGWYVQLGIGLTTTEESSGPDEEIDFDEGYLVPVALGRRYGTNDGGNFSYDVEVEGIFSDQDADDRGPIQAVRDVTGASLLLNWIGDLALAEALSVYAGPGIGIGWLNVGTNSDSFNDFQDDDGPFLAWQIKAGVRWRTGPGTSLSLGYRFLNIDDADIDDNVGNASFDLETQQHALELGLRFLL